MDKRIAIVDDEEIIRRLVSRVAGRLGYENGNIYQAKDGKEGLDLILKERPNIIITDYKMPKMTGADMLLESLRSGYTPDRVVVLSGDTQVAREILEEYPIEVTYLDKPIDMAEVNRFLTQ